MKILNLNPEIEVRRMTDKVYDRHIDLIEGAMNTKLQHVMETSYQEI